MIGGFAMGILMNEGAVDTDELADHLQRYQTYITNMSRDERRRLARSLVHTLEKFNAA